MNLKSLLSKSILELKKSGVPTPEIDAKVLLIHSIEKDASFVYSHPDCLVTNAQYERFRRYIRRRKKGEPIAYITSHKEFYGYDFFVNKNVLIPRPESEWLVDAGILFLRNYELGIMNQAEHNINILDMGTGSGCLAISLSKSIHDSKFMIHNSTIQIWATDLNSRAVAVAKKNSCKNNVENITFLNSNLFGNQKIKNKIFDLIIANLPYVPRNKKVVSLACRQAGCQLSALPAGRQVVRSIDFEPQDAIFSDDNGTAIIKKFLTEAKSHTKSGSMILIELDSRNANDILKFAQALYPTAMVSLQKDLASLNRYLTIAL